MGTRLSSQPLPLSPSAVTLNNTLSLITATITLRNKLVFSQRGTGTVKRRPPYACGLPFSLLRLNLFGDRRAEDQFGAQFSALYNSFSFFCLVSPFAPPAGYLALFRRTFRKLGDICMMYESDKLFCTTFLSCQTHDIKKRDAKKSFPFSFLFYHSMTSVLSHISCSDIVELLDKNEHQFSFFQKQFHTMLIRTIAAR